MWKQIEAGRARRDSTFANPCLEGWGGDEKKDAKTKQDRAASCDCPVPFSGRTNGDSSMCKFVLPRNIPDDRIKID